MKKLLLIFWEVIPKYSAEGKMLQEMILVCDAYRKVGCQTEPLVKYYIKHDICLEFNIFIVFNPHKMEWNDFLIIKLYCLYFLGFTAS